MKIQIYQTFHKNYQRNPNCDWIQPVGVSGYLEPGFQTDSEGDNISALNPYYCELTVQYWAWKNATADIVGFFHYRRYLNFTVDLTWRYASTVLSSPGDPDVIDYLTHDRQVEQIRHILDVAEIIVPKKIWLERDIQGHYLHYCQREPWEAFIAELKKRYPTYASHTDLFELTNLCSICNMYVMRKELFNRYCEELFPVIDAVYQQIGSPYDTYQNRYPGFLAERFLTFWLHVHRIRTFEAPIIEIS